MDKVYNCGGSNSIPFRCRFPDASAFVSLLFVQQKVFSDNGKAFLYLKTVRRSAPMFQLTRERQNNIIGYGTLALIVVSLAVLHLISLAVYFLFIFLLTDVFTNDLNRRFPVVHRTFLFWSFFILGLAAVGFITFIFLPVIVKDIPLYFALIREDSLRFIHAPMTDPSSE